MKTATTRLPSPLFLNGLAGDLGHDLRGNGLDGFVARLGGRFGNVGLVAASASTTVLLGAVAGSRRLRFLVAVVARVETGEVVLLVLETTDRVVAAHHVRDGGVFLVTRLLVFALTSCVTVAVGVETVRPAVAEVLEVHDAWSRRGALGDLAEGWTGGTTARSAVSGAFRRERRWLDACSLRPSCWRSVRGWR